MNELDNEDEENQGNQEYLPNNAPANNTLTFGDKSSFFDVNKGDVYSMINDLALKERLCCIELINNTRIYLKYELRWTIKDLIKNIVNHSEFKKLYSSRDWIFNSQNHLTLFDVHLALYRKIRSDSETKLDFKLTFDNLHNKGLLKNPKYPFFIFKDNRNNGELIQFHEDKIEFLEKIKENKYETYLMYKNYLPRVNPLNILNCHPEFESFYQSAKSAIYQLSEYNISSLIYEKKELEEKKSKKKKKNEKTKEKEVPRNSIKTSEKNEDENDGEVK